MQQEVHVKSSSSDSIYCVTFKLEDDTLQVYCDCQAGIYGKLCKHKLNILKGKTSNITDLNEYEMISDIISRVKNSDFIAYDNNIKETDSEIQKLNTKKRNLKKKLEQMLYEGFCV